jgi:hypothetical protein
MSAAVPVGLLSESLVLLTPSKILKHRNNVNDWRNSDLTMLLKEDLVSPIIIV